MTKKYRTGYWILFAISILLNTCPLAVYTFKAFMMSDLVVEKITLTLTLMLVLILSLVAWINKITIRSRLWIVLIGLYFALDYILTPLIIIACCQVVDELIVSPIKHSLQTKLTIHKELDKRL